MPLDPQIAVQATVIRTAWITPQPHATVARLPWTGFKAKDENTFFGQLFTHLNGYSGSKCQTSVNLQQLAGAPGNPELFAAWFNYFYAEAAGTLSGVSNTATRAEFEQRFARFASLMFDLDVEGSGSNARIKFQSAFPLPLSNSFTALLASQPGQIPKSILTYLFEVGFEEARVTTAGDYFGRTLALKSNMPDGVAVRSSKGEFVFAYRGDTRAVPTIISQGGAKCRTELDFWRRGAGVDRDWHPWSASNDDAKMWFRKGSKDNDYFTLNSLAKEFHISCAYPMFRSFEIHQDMVGPAAGWSATQRARLAAKNIVIRQVYDKKAATWDEVPSDETRVFACAIISGAVAATTFELNQYPESAVRNVTVEDMIAWVKVRRFHRPPGSAGEHYDSTRVSPSMTIKVMSWGWVRSEEETRVSLGCTRDGIKVIGAKLQNLLGKTFDISHTHFLGEATYDVDRQRVVAPSPVKPAEKPVRLTSR